MATLASSFIFLVAIHFNILHVNQPQNVREAYVCFNGNDSWPNAWDQMSLAKIDHDTLPVFKIKLPEYNITSYKFRFVFALDRTYGDTKWNYFVNSLNTNTTQSLSTVACNTFKETASTFKETSAILLYFISACSAIHTIKLFIKNLRRQILKNQNE